MALGPAPPLLLLSGMGRRGEKIKGGWGAGGANENGQILFDTGGP